MLLSSLQGSKEPGDRKPSKGVFGVLVGGEILNKKASIAKMDASIDRRAAGLQEPELSGPGYRLGPIAHLKLAVNVVDVFFHGANCDDQVVRYLLI